MPSCYATLLEVSVVSAVVEKRDLDLELVVNRKSNGSEV